MLQDSYIKIQRLKKNYKNTHIYTTKKNQNINQIHVFIPSQAAAFSIRDRMCLPRWSWGGKTNPVWGALAMDSAENRDCRYLVVTNGRSSPRNRFPFTKMRRFNNLGVGNPRGCPTDSHALSMSCLFWIRALRAWMHSLSFVRMFMMCDRAYWAAYNRLWQASKLAKHPLSSVWCIVDECDGMMRQYTLYCLHNETILRCCLVIWPSRSRSAGASLVAPMRIKRSSKTVTNEVFVTDPLAVRIMRCSHQHLFFYLFIIIFFQNIEHQTKGRNPQTNQTEKKNQTTIKTKNKKKSNYN